MRTKTVDKRWFQRTKMCKRGGNRAEKWHNHDIHMSFGMCSIICFMLLFAGIGTASATDYYYVAPGGNDSHPGNMTHPWQHPSYAAEQAQAGDTIYLMNGTWYGETIEFANSGTADNPIVVKAYNRRQAILDGQNKTNKWYYGIKIPSYAPRSNINISGLVITDYGTGITVSNGNNIHIDDCEIANGIAYGIALWDGTNNCSITNCDIHDQSDNSINLASSSVGVSNILIENNEIHDNPGIFTGPTDGHNMINFALFGAAITNVDIIGNEIYNKTVNGAPIYMTGGPNSGYAPAQFVTIKCNIFRDNHRGVVLFSLEDSEMSNNVVYNHQIYGIEVYAPLNASIKNNIVTDCGTGIWRSLGQGNVTLSYNDVWNNGGDYSSIDPGETDISADPLFADPANNDFHLKSTGERWNGATWVNDIVTSPCIDAGDPNDSCTNEDYPPINMGAYGNTIEASRSVGAATGTISGNVTDTNGTVIIDATVTDGTRYVTTNETGTYRIANIPEGTYTLTGSKKRYINLSEHVTVIAEQTITVNFELNPVGDTSTPTTNATLIPAPDETGWNNVTPVVVTSFRSSNDSGISHTNYSKTSETGPWTTVTTSAATGPDAENVTEISEGGFNVKVSDEGTTQIWFYSVDIDSNVEHPKNITVKIDITPNIKTVILQSPNDVTDNRLREASPDAVLGSTTFIDVGRIGSTGNYRDVIWFNLSQLNSTDLIESAKLSLFWYYESRDMSTTVEIYRPVDWAETYVNWNNRTNNVAWIYPGGDWYDTNNLAQGNTPYAAVTFPVGAADNVYHEFDVTELVQSYVDGIYENSGFFIKANEVSDGYIAFRSSDWANASERPKLVVSYGSGDAQQNTLSGTVTGPCGTNIANATVTLTTRPGAEINTTQTDSTGHYAFADVDAGFYDITATKRSYWSNTNNVTVTAEAPETADIVLCQKGDLNTNSEPADAGDLAMMADATEAGTSDVTYDLDGNGNPADEADLTLLKEVSVGVAELE